MMGGPPGGAPGGPAGGPGGPGDPGGPGGPAGPGGPGGPGGPPNMMMQQPNAGEVNPMDTILSGEVWVETKDGNGKPYYYNARTRETTWTKPEGNLRVLTQEQVRKHSNYATALKGSPGHSV